VFERSHRPLIAKAPFEPELVRVRFVSEEVALEQGFLQVLRFPLSVSFLQCSIPIFILILLNSEGQAGEAWDPSNKAVPFRISEEQWTEKYHHNVLVLIGLK
jgi:hypothetical protein